MTPKTLEEFYKEYRSKCNPITGEPNMYKDITDQMIWDASIQQFKVEILSVANDLNSFSHGVNPEDDLALIVKCESKLRELSNI